MTTLAHTPSPTLPFSQAVAFPQASPLGRFPGLLLALLVLLALIGMVAHVAAV